jgi:hypothetical protein
MDGIVRKPIPVKILCEEKNQECILPPRPGKAEQQQLPGPKNARMTRVTGSRGV